MSLLKRLGLMLVLMFTLSCSGNLSNETTQNTTPTEKTATPIPLTATPIPPTVTPLLPNATPVPPTITPVPPAFKDEISSIKTSAQQILADQLQVSPKILVLVHAEKVVWPNSSLGCPKSGMMYAQVMTPGFQIIFKYKDDSYPIHTNLDGSSIVICYVEETIIPTPIPSSVPTPHITQTNTPIPAMVSNPPQDSQKQDSIPSYIKNAWLCTSNNVSEVDDLSTSQIETWKCEVSIEYNADRMIITSNGIPNHTFESGLGGPASTQNYKWIIPLNPVANETIVMAPERGPIAVTVTGVPLYGPEEGPGGDAVALHHNYFVEDRQPIELGICGGHSGPVGTYHYHFDGNCMHWHASASNQWKDILNWNTDMIDSTKHSPVIGFAFDGFAIYGPFGYDKDGILVEMKSSYQLRPNQNGYGGIDDWEYVEGLGHLDECNGILSLVPESQEPIYHYHSTQKNGADQIGFPYFLLCYKGIPDQSNFNTGALKEKQEPLPQNSRPPPPKSRQRR